MAVQLPLEVASDMAGAQPTSVRRSPHMGERLSFGETMRRLRIARGLSQDDLAESAKTDKGTISEYERKPDKVPEHDLAKRIIVALHADPEPFLRAMGYEIGQDLPVPKAVDRAMELVAVAEISEQSRELLGAAFKMAEKDAGRRHLKSDDPPQERQQRAVGP